METESENTSYQFHLR